MGLQSPAVTSTLSGSVRRGLELMRWDGRDKRRLPFVECGSRDRVRQVRRGWRRGLATPMDYELLTLIAMMAAAIAVGVKLRAARPRREYQRVFSATAAGLLFLVAGLAGWDLSHSHGFFQGTKWVGGPIWWQIGLGTAFLLLAGFWFRRSMTGEGPDGRSRRALDARR